MSAVLGEAILGEIDLGDSEGGSFSQTISPSSVASAEAFGSSTIHSASLITASSISSSEAFGSTTVVSGNANVSPSGIVSAGALGTVVLANANTISFTGLSSAEAFGASTIVPGNADISPSAIGTAGAFGTTSVSSNITALPSSISSSNAFGSHTLSPGNSNVSPSAIASTEVFGTALAQLDTIILASIISTEAFGSVNVAQAQIIVVDSLASLETFGATSIKGGHTYIMPKGIDPRINQNPTGMGNPILLGGDPGFAVYINNVKQFVLLNTCRVRRQLATVGTAALSIFDPVGDQFPDPGSDIKIVEFGKTAFAGTVDNVEDFVYPSTSMHQYNLNCVDYNAICSRRVYTAEYPAGSLGWNIVKDVVFNGLSNENVTANHIDATFFAGTPPTNPDGLPTGLVYRAMTVKDILDDLQKVNPVGETWYIDNTKDMHFHHPSSATAYIGMPVVTIFDLVSNNGKYRNDSGRPLTVATSRINYRNRQFVRVNHNIVTSGRTETIVVTSGMIPFGGGANIITQFPIVTPPDVTINGSPITLLAQGIDPNATLGWFYIPNGVGIFNLFASLTVGDVIVITYNSFADNVVVASNDTAIAARAAVELGMSGIYDNLFEAKDQTYEQALQVAHGLLNKYSTDLPATITYETDEPDIDIGRMQTVSLPEFGVAGQFICNQIDAVAFPVPLGKGSYFRRSVTITTADAGNSTDYLGTIIHRTKQGAMDVQHERPTLNITDGQIQIKAPAGPPYQVKRSGYILSVTGSLSIAAHAAPIVIDIQLLKIATGMQQSIFNAGFAMVLKPSDPANTIVLSGSLNKKNIAVVKDDILIFNVVNSDDGTARNLSVVINIETPR